MILPSPASTKELTALECVNPGGSKPVSRFVPSILVKFGWDHDAEVCALQLVHGWLSIHTPGVLHHAPFPIDNAVIEPWNWRMKGIWYFFMEECQGVPLNTIIEGMSPTKLDHITDQLLTILDEMHSYTSTMLASITSGPYNN